MKNKKLVKLLIFVLLIAVMSLTLTACKFAGNDGKHKKHTWETAWTYDTTHHWHKCTGCNEVNGKALHSGNGNNCSVCGKTGVSIEYELSEDKSYAICTGLKEGNAMTEVVIADSFNNVPVTKIANNFCKDNSKITKVVIPDSITSVGYYAFLNCTALSNVTLGKGMSYLGYGMFEGCSNLTKIDIPSNVKLIFDESFYGCTSLSEVNISEGVLEINEKTFYNTPALKSIKLPSTLTTISNAAFTESGLTSINIPNSVTALGEETSSTYSVFYGCKSLEEVTIGSGIKTIQASTFASLPALKKVTLAEGVETIKDKAFYNCPQLANINFPNSLKVIGDSAFSGIAITEFTLPKNIEQIDSNAFSDCINLKKITLTATTKPVILGDINGYSPFINEPDWLGNNDKIGVEEIVIEEGFQYDKSNDISALFKGCKKLKKVTIASDFCPTKSMFQDCALLTEIHFNGTKVDWLQHTQYTDMWYDIETNKKIGSWWDKNTGEYTVYCQNGETATKGEKATV